jgi:glucan phosphoethanolaminetransferase (alkaline phosphatase superfamily)
MDIKVKININKKEHIKFTLYSQRKAMGWTPLVVILLLLIICIWLDVLRSRETDAFFLSYMVAILGALVFFVNYLYTIFWARREWKTSAFAGESVDFTFSDAVIRMESARGSVSIGYETIFKICESQTAFYMYLSSASVIVVPKRCFENTEDVRALREFFVKNIDKKKLKLRNKSALR